MPDPDSVQVNSRELSGHGEEEAFRFRVPDVHPRLLAAFIEAP